MKTAQLESIENVFTMLEQIEPRWIDISGLTCSGKSTLLHSIISKFKVNAIREDHPQPTVEIFDRFGQNKNSDWQTEASRMEEYFTLLERKVKAGVNFNAPIVIGMEHHPELCNSTSNPLQVRKTILNVLLQQKKEIMLVSTHQYCLDEAVLGLLGTSKAIEQLAFNIVLGDSALKLARQSWKKDAHNDWFEWLKAQKYPCVVSGCGRSVQPAILPTKRYRDFFNC